MLRMGFKFRNATRLAQIANVFARHGFWSIIERIGIRNDLSQEQFEQIESSSKEAPELNELTQSETLHTTRSNLGLRLRQAFEELGPAFIKFGQFLAAREDLIPSNITNELKKLHDQVQTLSFSTIEEVLKKEWDAERISEFEIQEKPIAAGSIGQVHKARLANGEEVVIKIQKPQISEMISADCQLMTFIASLIDRYIPQLKYLNLTQLTKEFSRVIHGELDFIKEAANTTKFSQNFKEVEYIVFPKVYWDYTTSKVLVLEYLEGIPASKVQEIKRSNLSPQLITERGCEMFLQMSYIDGLLHGDLHAGNLLIQKENKIAVLDFGVAIRFSPSTRESLAGLVLALTQEDYESITHYFLELTDPGPAFDIKKFEHEITNTLSPYMGLSLKKINSSNILWELAGIAAKYQIHLPSELIIFLKTLATFESIGEQLDPDFDILASSQKYASKIVQAMYGPDAIKKQTLQITRDISKLAKHAPWQMRRVLDAAVEGKLSFKIKSQELDRLSRSLHQASSKLSISFIIGSLIIGSSILSFGRVGHQFYGISTLGVLGLALAAFLGIYILWTFFTKK